MQQKTPKETDHPEELIDLVNEQDEVVGTATRKEIYQKGLRNYRVIHAFIINDEGQIWTPRRLDTKKLYPGGLDYSIAGHVESGETYEEALFKEAREETNLDLSQMPYEEIGYFNPHQHEVHCFGRVYKIRSDDAPDYNPNDFSGFEWLSPQAIIDRHHQGESMKEDIPETLRLCGLVS